MVVLPSILLASATHAEQLRFLMLESTKFQYVVPIPESWTILGGSWPSKNAEFGGNFEGDQIWLNIKSLPLGDWAGKNPDEDFFSNASWEERLSAILEEIKRSKPTLTLYEYDILELRNNRFLYFSTEYKLGQNGNGQTIFSKTWITKGKEYVYHISVHLPSDSSDLTYGLINTIVENFKINIEESSSTETDDK